MSIHEKVSKRASHLLGHVNSQAAMHLRIFQASCNWD